MSVTAALSELARRYGVHSGYRDPHGRVRRADPGGMTDILRMLGAEDLHEPEDAPACLEALERATPIPELAPVIVAWAGGRRSAGARVPAGASARATLQLEDATVLECPVNVEPDRLAGTRLAAATVRLPRGLPPGYHQLVLEAGRWRGQATVIAAPPEVYRQAGRRRGIFAPVHALRSERSGGCGSYADLEALGNWVADAGGSVLATLPMLASFLGPGRDPSPYAPVSRCRWNELYLDLAEVPEVRAAPRARGRAEAASAELSVLRAAPMADQGAQALIARGVLEEAYRWLRVVSSARRHAFERYLAADPDVSRYARFRAAGERHGQDWRRWPAAVHAGLEADTELDEVAGYHAYVQWLAAERVTQLRNRLDRRGVSLYLDLPVGVHPDGYDAWRHRDAFVDDARVGAPPDLVFTSGQNWGFPPLHPMASRRNGHVVLRQAISQQMAAAHLVRVDHVMAWHRLFWIPRGRPIPEGAYVKYPHDELYAVLSVESHRHSCEVVGENLGIVPGYVDEALRRRRVRTMWVAQYSLAGGGIEPPTPDAAACIGTHDMPTFAGWWAGDDIEDRVDLGFLAAEDEPAARESRARQRRMLATASGVHEAEPTADRVLDGLLSALGAGEAEVAVANLEDLWGEVAPQNVPGTFDERPNWRSRARHTVEELPELETVNRRLGLLCNPALVPRPGALADWSQSAFTPDDLYLFNEGSHLRLWDLLGAHPAAGGVRFAVWAPNARRVTVVGDFNDWESESSPMRSLGESGIWETFVPGAVAGQRYKYRISTPVGETFDRADPFAFAAELPPATASVIWDGEYSWRDGEWMAERGRRHHREARISVYEVHLGSWRRGSDGRMLGYREIAPLLADHVAALGFTHVELLPLTEHPFFGSWGYQTTGYFAPTARYGPPEDLMAFVDVMHQRGIGVILDWVPSHFPDDPHGLARFDGTHLYEHADPRRGWHPDWNSAVFNYGRHEVRAFLLCSALYWLERFHVDGLRVDAVASMLYLDYSREEGEWLPNEQGGREDLEAIDFLRRLNEEVYGRHPDTFTVAEESTAWPMVTRPTHMGGLGFGFKWDMGWMHDTLTYFARDPIHRRHHHRELTFRGLYAFHENFVLSISHDEVVHGKGSLLSKMPGDEWQRFANLRLLLGYQFGLPGKTLLFMGTELAPDDEWYHERQLDWGLAGQPLRAGLSRWISDLNGMVEAERALHVRDAEPDGFAWVDADDAERSLLSFLRKAPGAAPVLVVCNFTPVPRHEARVGVDLAGFWRELANSDATIYGGSGQGNLGGAHTSEVRSHGRACSLSLTVPPLGVVFMRYDPDAGG